MLTHDKVFDRCQQHLQAKNTILYISIPVMTVYVVVRRRWNISFRHLKPLQEQNLYLF